MAKADIHSLETYFYKYLLPAAFIPWDGFQSFLAAFPPGSPDRTPILAIMIGVYLIFGPLIFWYAYRLKRVALVDNRLVVKGYLKEIQVPLADVEAVEEAGFPVKYAVLKLKGPTEFGDRIRFIPKRIFKLNAAGVLADLRERIGEAKAAARVR